LRFGDARLKPVRLPVSKAHRSRRRLIERLAKRPAISRLDVPSRRQCESVSEPDAQQIDPGLLWARRRRIIIGFLHIPLDLYGRFAARRRNLHFAFGGLLFCTPGQPNRKEAPYDGCNKRRFHVDISKLTT
jgi:hypothetical protein